MHFAIWNISGINMIYNGKHAGTLWDSLQGWERETITVKYFKDFADMILPNLKKKT